MNTRSTALFGASLLLGAALAGPALAQSYPERQIRIFVGFSAGGTADAMARLLADHLAEKSGQTVIVDNLTGASGNTASNAVVTAAPDGYTLLMASTGNVVINQFLYDNMAFDPVEDLEPIAFLTEAQQYLAISSALPVDDLQGLIELARERPGELSYASSGMGSTTHLGMEMFAQAAGVELLHVPYGGAAPAVADVAAGRVDMVNIGLNNLQNPMEQGEIKVLVVASPNPSPVLPDVPTAAQAGLPEYDMSNWYGLFGPRGLPDEIVAYLNEAVNEMLGDPARQTAFEGMRQTPRQMTSEAFGEMVRAEADRWRRVIETAGIEME